MQISEAGWSEYVKRLAQIDEKAGQLMQVWIDANGLDDLYAAARYAYSLVSVYGEAAAALACEMYDTAAEASGKVLPPAEPAPTATFEETATAVRGTVSNRHNSVPDTVSRLTKQAAADTTLQNARRDGAQFAWVPHGDTCAFCIMLASNGWQNVSKKALRNGHAEHIHAHCDCEYAVRFDDHTTVAGYDPDRYYDMYRSAEGSTWEEKVNSMRREQYARNKEYINGQKRAAYQERKERLNIEGKGDKVTSGAISGALNPFSERAQEHAENYYESVRHMTNDAERIANNTGFTTEEIRSIKDCVFIEKHDFGDGQVDRFTPSYEMAESWQRLIDGKNIQPHDITLLRHELLEQELISRGLSQEEAHIIASEKYNYNREAEAFYDKTQKHKKTE